MIRVKVRLVDIAKLANVSVATVSIVLNNPDTTRISESKKTEIMGIAEELNYFPNKAAQSLVTNRSQTIGLVIPDIENPFFSTFAKVVEQQLRQYGYVVIIMNTLEDHENDPGVIRSLRQRNVDGMIIALSSKTFTDDKKVKAVLRRLDVPYVLVDRILNNFNANQVYFNNKQGEYLVTKYLIDNGHRKIGYISTKDHAMTGFYRHQGYIKALKEAGIEINEKFIRHGIYDAKTGYSFAEDLYNEGITAIACANDLIAYGVQKRLFEMGLRVPEDVSIVGYDNLSLNNYIENGLTSIDQDITELAHQSVNILMGALAGEKKPKEVILQPTLAIRKSVKNLNNVE